MFLSSNLTCALPVPFEYIIGTTPTRWSATTPAMAALAAALIVRVCAKPVNGRAKRRPADTPANRRRRRAFMFLSFFIIATELLDVVAREAVDLRPTAWDSHQPSRS